MAWFLSSIHCWKQAPGCKAGKASMAGCCQITQVTATHQARSTAALPGWAHLETVVSVDPSPSWGPGQKEEYSYLHGTEKMKPTLLAILLREYFLPPLGVIFPTALLPAAKSYPSTSLSPSFSTVKMVCEMLLGDVKVLEWLLITGFEGAFSCPAMKQVA